MLRIYGRITSFNVQKVLWLADELTLKYEHIQVGGRFGGLDSDEFGRINPIRKIPVLLDGDQSIWESHTILRYLAAQYGGDAWHPENAYQRSLCDRWLDWSQTTFQPAFMGAFWGFYRTPPQSREMREVEKHLVSCNECLEILAAELKMHPFLGGEHLSLADIPTGAVLYRLTEMGLETPLPGSVSKWYQKLKRRRGYQKWVMSDFLELKGRETF